VCGHLFDDGERSLSRAFEIARRLRHFERTLERQVRS
jgi:hypothetical protein